MINLLPPEVKQDSSYAKRNKVLLHYIWLLVFVIVLLGLEFGGAEAYMAQQRHNYDQKIAEKSQSMNDFNGLEDKALAANTRVTAFKQLLAQQTSFSGLLTDLANHTPKGVFINSITLTGVTTTAVEISGTATSYESAASLRDALATSPRIRAASLNSISNPSAGVYSVDVTVAFAPGAFK